jgi:hypothetical protein
VTIRRHLPLLVCGVVALLLATTPKIGFIGRAMVSLGSLFPSRFPASDYKAAIAIAIVVISAEAWAQLAATRRVRIWPVLALGCALVIATVIAPSTDAPPTRTLWLVLILIAATVALVLWRPRPELLVAALIGLIVIDGVRDTRDIRLKGTISSWQMPPSQAAVYRANQRHLHNLLPVLRSDPVTRPPRVPPSAPISVAPRGTPPDAAGWIADGYHFNDYTGPLERVLWDVEQSSTWTRLMLEPWHAYVFPCAAATCAGQTRALPPPGTWRPSPSVRTLSYTGGRVMYEVHLTRPAVMVENELAIRGWRSNTPRAQVIKSGLPLRTWRLAPGTYRFTATYHESGRTMQALAAALALLAWLGSVVLLRKRRAVEPPKKSALSATVAG